MSSTGANHASSVLPKAMHESGLIITVSPPAVIRAGPSNILQPKLGEAAGSVQGHPWACGPVSGAVQLPHHHQLAQAAREEVRTTGIWCGCECSTLQGWQQGNTQWRGTHSACVQLGQLSMLLAAALAA